MLRSSSWLFAFVLSAGQAAAHATLDVPQAVIGKSYKATIKIGHGCKGSPTTSIQVLVPAGVIAVKPMPKAGWTLATSKAAYGKSYNYFGKPVSEGVTQVTWSGGKLSDDHYDEFTFNALIADSMTPGPLYIPIVQTCEIGEHRWVDIPAAGQDAHSLTSPAPRVQLVEDASKAAATKTYTVGSLVIERPWSRATPDSAKVAGGYVRITNNGSHADRLIGGTLSLAGAVEVHEMAVVDGVMRMRQLERGIEIGAGQAVDLKPGGLHLMFLQLTGGLAQGQRVKGTLVFEKAGVVAVEFDVAPMGAQTSGGGTHQH